MGATTSSSSTSSSQSWRSRWAVYNWRLAASTASSSMRASSTPMTRRASSPRRSRSTCHHHQVASPMALMGTASNTITGILSLGRCLPTLISWSRVRFIPLLPLAMLMFFLTPTVLISIALRSSPCVRVRVVCLSSIFQCFLARIHNCGIHDVKITLRCMVLSHPCGSKWLQCTLRGGGAARWLQTVERRIRDSTWDMFCTMVHDRFGRNQHEALIRQLFHIRQLGTIAEYVEKFSTLADQFAAY
jgi:hypothetical protein